MNRIITNIVAAVLLAVFPLTAAGVSIHHHVCKKHNERNSSVFVATECSHHQTNETQIPTCCEKHQNENQCCKSSSDCSDNGNANSASHDLQLGKTNCCTNFVEYIALNDSFLSKQKSDNKIILAAIIQNSFILYNSKKLPINDKSFKTIKYKPTPVSYTISYIKFSTPATISDDFPAL